MNESSGKSSGSAQSRESTVASQVRCLLPSCCWFSVWGVGNERERGKGRGRLD